MSTRVKCKICTRTKNLPFPVAAAQSMAAGGRVVTCFTIHRKPCRPHKVTTTPLEEAMIPTLPVRKLPRSAAVGLLLLFLRRGLRNSVLTHEAISFPPGTAPSSRSCFSAFPAATGDELEQAHAYAYGGCIISGSGVLSVR